MNFFRGLNKEQWTALGASTLCALMLLFGFSGGIDSTTLATILSPALKNRLLAVTIDGGHLREGELEEIKRHHPVSRSESAGRRFEHPCKV